MTIRALRTLTVAVAISAVLSATGCAAGSQAEAPPATVTATATVTASGEATAETTERSTELVDTSASRSTTETDSSSAEENGVDPEIAFRHCPATEDALELVNDWADVVESRGASLHELKVSGFKESVADLQATSARGAVPCPGFDELANVNMQISGLEIMTQHLEVPGDEFYQAVTNAGDEWLETADHGGLMFMQP